MFAGTAAPAGAERFTLIERVMSLLAADFLTCPRDAGADSFDQDPPSGVRVRTSLAADARRRHTILGLGAPPAREDDPRLGEVYCMVPPSSRRTKPVVTGRG